ncbi:MAG: 50S ribosomal protein L25 [Candidatus Marinimicrobia bacterium]|nr:50S ribosomal protein L25 [Candidatus Neomarinimicrobiota bacterium]MCF7829049.1 50S ribosomal protein L25 [Candidatus Neomarinimicrobiota bacterium]MCF7881814.1 50S ribosomal protein L25 [Candidatus Neomarinimicrobiota bacterium]
MATVELKAKKRKELGKKATKDLRKDDQIPAVLYSREVEATPISIDKSDLFYAMQTGARVINLKVGRKKQPAILREVQHHPVTDEILHIDFLGIVEGQAVETRVGISLVGEPIGVREEGGILEQIMWDAAIRTIPSKIPESLEVNVDELHMGDSVQVSDLEMEGIEILEPSDRAVATVVHPTQLVVEEEEPEEEELELEEGEEPEEGEEGEEESGEGEEEEATE